MLQVFKHFDVSYPEWATFTSCENIGKVYSVPTFNLFDFEAYQTHTHTKHKRVLQLCFGKNEAEKVKQQKQKASKFNCLLFASATSNISI